MIKTENIPKSVLASEQVDKFDACVGIDISPEDAVQATRLSKTIARLGRCLKIMCRVGKNRK